jgi:prepilin-type processing-associated H-X9-DG protein
MRLLERNLLRFSAYAAILFVLLALLMPAFACAYKRASPRVACLSNLKQQGLGLVMYANDNADRLPDRDVWKDAIAPYVKSESSLHEFQAPEGIYGYAFNSGLPRVREDDPKALMVYDSVNPIRNASDRLASLPEKGKHDGKNNVVYADGHVKGIPGGTAP